MEQHIPWTEVVRDIILLPLKCCLMEVISDDNGDHSVRRRESTIRLWPRQPIARTTDKTPILTKSNSLRHVPKKIEPGESRIPFYYCFLENEVPGSIESALIEEGQWDLAGGGNDDTADDQDTEVDPFEYDNAPEYCNILGQRVSSGYNALDLDAYSAIEDRSLRLTQSLCTVKRVLEMGLKVPQGEEAIG